MCFSDHRNRLSIPQSLFHSYLTHGVPASCVAELARHLESNTTGTVGSEDGLPQPMEPQALHLLPPLKLPEDQLRSGAELADQQWSRRQFSVLWAPMPADYQLDDADERAKKVSIRIARTVALCAVKFGLLASPWVLQMSFIARCKQYVRNCYVCTFSIFVGRRRRERWGRLFECGCVAHDPRVHAVPDRGK